LAPDIDLLLVLIAVRIMGGHDVPATHEVFKGLKNGLAKALNANLVAQSERPIIGKNGKAGKKLEKHLSLTAAGEQELQKTGSQAADAAAARVALARSLDADRQALVAELRAAAKKGVPQKKSDPSKEIAAFAKDLQKLSERLTKLEGAIQSGSGSDASQAIDRAFAAFAAKLETATPPATPSKIHEPQGHAAQPTLAEALQIAYRTLGQFIEYNDGLIPIPVLFHETRRSLPNLTLADYHKELQALWSQRVLELKVLNEVQKAAERDKAIQRGDNLYYYVYWAHP
jgi:hypothetical protein